MYKKFKRLMDILFALAVLVVLCPLMLIVAAAIKIEDPKGTVFFKQKRPGLHEKIFKIYKFRTMKADMYDSEGNPLSDMQRITKVGRILRKCSLDELPQFLNVLKGDMSLIGPRPLLVQYLKHYNAEQRRRHDVRPGISGWAQVNGRNALTWEEKFKLDVWYVDHISLKLDIKIIFMTIKNVLIGKNVNQSKENTMTYFGE